MEDNRPDIRIENNVATWEINAVGDILGLYTGTFRFRCFLTPLMQISAGKEERELMGPNLALANEHERFLAYSLTQLKYRIISAPPFWSSANTFGGLAGDVPDESVINLVLSAAIDAEVKYKAEIKERKEEAVKRARKAAEAITKKELEDREENEELEKS